MIVKLLSEHHLEFLSLKGGWSESSLVKMSNCWKSHATAHIIFVGDENKKQLLDLGAMEHVLHLMQSEDKIVRRNSCMVTGVMTGHRKFCLCQGSHKHWKSWKTWKIKKKFHAWKNHGICKKE